MRSSPSNVLPYPLQLVLIAAIAVFGLSFAQSASAQPAAELAACRAHTCEAYCKRLGGPPKQIGECSGACKQTCAGDIPPGNYVTLNTGDIKLELAGLAGTTLSLDTTMTAPGLTGPPTVSLPNPAYGTCYAQLDGCKTGPKDAQKVCVDRVDKECAGIPTHIERPTNYFSYLQFSESLKHTVLMQTDGKTTLNDYVFNFSAPHIKALGGLTFDINYIHWTAAVDILTLTNLEVAFSPGVQPGGYSDVPPALNLTLTGIQSNHPTLLVHNSDPAGAIVPNINISDIAVAVTLKGWKPNADGTAVDYTDEDALISRRIVADHLNVSGLSILESATSTVNAKVASIFAQSSVHKAISAVITSAVKSRLPKDAKITRLIGKGGNWLIYYEGSCGSTVKGLNGRIMLNTTCAKLP